MKLYMTLTNHEEGTKLDIYKEGNDLYTVKCSEYFATCYTWRLVYEENHCTQEYIYDTYQLGV